MTKKAPSIILATAIVAAGTLCTSAADARGFRMGFGIGIGVPLAMYGAHHYQHSAPRREVIVDGRYRCCSEPAAKPRHAPKVTRDTRREEAEEQEEKRRAARKKPAKSEETQTASQRSRPAKTTADKTARPVKPPVQTAATSPITQDPSQAAGADPATVKVEAPAPIATRSALPGTPTLLSSIAPGAEKGVETAQGASDLNITTATAETGAKPRLQAGQQHPQAKAPAPAAQQAAATAAGDLNCRKYVPSLGQTIAVSCFE